MTVGCGGGAGIHSVDMSRGYRGQNLHVEDLRASVSPDAPTVTCGIAG